VDIRHDGGPHPAPKLSRRSYFHPEATKPWLRQGEESNRARA
jgi:hypothetical protein